MLITAETLEAITILHLQGDFDTFQCPRLQEEIEVLLTAGRVRVALDLRHVKFMNSTALGAIVQAAKELSLRDGRLVVCRPSPFCRQIMGKVGLERAVPVYDSDEEAAHALLCGENEPARDDIDDELEHETSLLFSPIDPERVGRFIPERRRTGRFNPVHRHRFGSSWRGVGRLIVLDDAGLHFRWNGGATRLTPFEMARMFAAGTDVLVKFRLPLLRRGFCRAVVTVRLVVERLDGVEISATFDESDAQALTHVRQYTADLAFLKEELRTDRGARSAEGRED